jgi:outer membrane protein assembly factor BamB
VRRLLVVAAIVAGCGPQPVRPRHDRLLWEANEGGVLHADLEKVVVWRSPRLAAHSAARGTLAWQAELRGTPEHVAGPTLVYRSSDSQETMVAIDIADGRERWRYFAKDYAKLFVAGGRCYLAERNGLVHAVDGFTGECAWKEPTVSHALVSQLAADGERVYGVDAEGQLVAWAIDTGKIAWKSEVGQTLDPLGLVAGRVLVNSGTLARKLVAYDAATGKRAWAWDRPAGPTGAWIHGGGLACYVVGATMHVIDAESGARLWERIVHAPPVVGDGAVLVAAFESLVACDARTGQVRWEAKGLSRVHCADAELVVASDDRRLVVLDAKKGSLRWEFAAWSEVRWAKRCGPLLAIETYDRPPGREPVRHTVAVLRVE